MGQDKTKLMRLFNFVKDIYNDPDNKEFAVCVQSLVLAGNNIPQDINDIRRALGLRGKQSISYDFVKEESVRMQLCVDNLRMENVILNLTADEKERFSSFCVNAHLQIEGLLNYFYSIKHKGDISSIIKDIKDSTSKVGYTDMNTGKYVSKAYSPSPEQEKRIMNVESIPVYNKLMAFVEGYKAANPGEDLDKIYRNLDYLRNQRNDAFHRGIPAEDNTGKKGYTPYPSVIRRDLQYFVKIVKESLS